jgi:CRP/FNR family transcriptional regulator, dissimilatory nitrate respiration regulator
MSIYVKLSQSPVFKGIPPAEIEKLLAHVRTQTKKYKKGTTIAFRDDPCNELIIVLEGSVRGEMPDRSGRIMEVETIPAPKPIAAAFVFGIKNRFPVDAVANEDLTVLSIPKESLVQSMQSNSTVLTNFLDLISSKTHFLTERLMFMSFKTIREKMIHYILNLKKTGDNRITLPKNQQELSEFFGVSRPSLARVIGELEKENIIRRNRREIFIIDPQKLLECSQKSH